MDGAKQKRVLLTRENNETLAEALRANGVEVLELPLIKTVHEAQNEDVEDIMREMGSYDWITFSSANGVKGFFREFFKNFDDIRTLGVARIACVGEATAAEGRKLHLRPDVVPAVSTALAMADAMAEYETLDNLKVLCVQGNLSLPDLPKTLDEKHRAIVDTAVVYKTEQVEVGADDIQKEFDLNMRGTWLPSKVMTPLLIGQQGACVLNVSSMSAFTPLTRIPGYSGAKAGVSNFTQWLATYLARSGVRVNAIAPGFFMTEQNHALQFNPDGTPTPRCAHIVDGTPMRRYGELRELIGAMLFLVDERAASFVTGVVLPVDGGYSAFSGV